MSRLKHGQVEKGKVDLNPDVLQRAEIPKSLYKTTVEKSSSGEAKDKVDMYIDKLWKAYDTGLGLLFYGPPKSGKSGFASIIAKHALNWGFRVLFKDSSTIISSVINRDKFEDNTTYQKRFREVDFLVIDDIQPSKNENRFSMLFDIIKERDKWNKPTIITTKIPKDYLYQYFPMGFEEMLKTSFEVIPVKSDKWLKKLQQKREIVFGEYDN
jgi:chromosomal replication initiator protein